MVEQVARRRGRWFAVAALAVALPVLTFALQQGQCWDVGWGGETDCTSGPAIGWPAAWSIAVVCAPVLVLSLIRALRRERPAR